jgi:hypothetical protein
VLAQHARDGALAGRDRAEGKHSVNPVFPKGMQIASFFAGHTDSFLLHFLREHCAAHHPSDI